MKKLRLLVTDKCNRTCPGCCNKQWDLNKLPRCHDFTPYHEVILTGGEPLLRPDLVIGLVDRIKATSMVNTKIFLYTAWSQRVLHVLPYLDGVTLTLHECKDLEAFRRLARTIHEMRIDHVPWVVNASLRLNVFGNIDPRPVSHHWNMKLGIERIENCPLPADEVFMRL